MAKVRFSLQTPKEAESLFSAVTGVEKWSLVTTHTARRSFATNEYLRASREGRDWRQIMDITGHATERQFFEYVKVRADVRALGFAKAREAG